MSEAKWNTFSFNVLLSNTTHDLRDVDVSTFGTSTDHVLHLVFRIKILEGQLASLISCLVELCVHFSFERLKKVFTRLKFEFASLSFINNFVHLLSIVVKFLSDFLHCSFSRNCILDTNCKAMLNEPLVNDVLRV